MQNSLFNTNFLGKDGNPFWIGQIPPETGSSFGWGNRAQVRILGYHPLNEGELPNKDLPYAQCILPSTAGSGGGQVANSIRLTPGDTVFGCFLDGEAGQYPIILGTFGRTLNVSTEDYSRPFAPFTGFGSSFVENGRLWADQSNEKGKQESQPTPRDISPAGVDKINQALQNSGSAPYEKASFDATGKKIVFADTCKDSGVKSITAEVSNFLNKVANALDFVADLPNELRKTVDKIAGIANKFVGQMFNALYKELIGLLKSGLQALYDTVFAKVLASTGSIPNAHAAGVAAQLAMAQPVNALENAIPCVASKIVNGLKDTIKELLESVVENVTNFVTCAAEQFVGAFLNTVIDSIEEGLGGVLGAVSKILSPFFSVSSFLRSTIDTVKSIGGFFDCNQDKSKCYNLIKEWTIGQGVSKSEDENIIIEKILNGMNVAAGIRDSFTEGIEKKLDEWDIFNTKDGTTISPYGGCYTGTPTNCGPPSVRIFGGGGLGAVGKAVLGSFVRNTAGLNDIINQVSYTASIIGVKIENPGSGYRYPPFVEFVDECGRGYGAVGRALINDEGEVSSIYMVSVGENYTVSFVEDQTSSTQTSYSVTRVQIVNSGNNYTSKDVVKDNKGNTYSIKVDNGRIVEVIPNTLINIPVTDLPIITVSSSTGTGAILKPILDDYRPPQGELKQVIDCIK
jgi:hypothetical protein